MKPILEKLLQSATDALHGRHLMREYLQARVLQSMQQAGAMVPLAFHGGTALRFLYQIPRYSEDLDFALEQYPGRYDFRAYLRAIKRDLTAETYPVALRVNDKRVVHSAFVRFRGLLHEFGLSPHADEVLSIKIEVDTQPPAGAGLETTVIRRRELLNLQHHDRASLLAGKLHAILQRPYTKGRDVYDLFWYLSNPDWPSPNLTLLQNTLTQTEWSGFMPTEANWREIVAEALAKMDWPQAVADVRPFLMSPTEADLLTYDNIRKLLQ